MAIKNFYSVRPHELEVGDVLVCTVTAHVVVNMDGKGLACRLYRCPYPVPPHLQSREGVPQGTRILMEPQHVANELFPVLRSAGIGVDLAW